MPPSQHRPARSGRSNPGPGTATPVPLLHRPALDGLRGAAVIGVVAYHFDLLRGGYLGVDLFFVLSGFLITSLLLDEIATSGTVSLGRFWSRRIGRLLPGLLLFLIGGAIYARWGATNSELAAIRHDGLSGLFYVANWTQISSNVDYWDHFTTPSIFRHLWSLAIEEQFYLVWPIVALLVSMATRRPARSIGVVAVIGAFLSASFATLLFHPGQATTRIYFGTDTRIAAILMGAATATLGWIARNGRPHPRSDSKPVVEIVRDTTVALSLVFLVLCWTFIDGTNPILWRGGLIGCGFAAAAVIGIFGSSNSGRFAPLFTIPILRWLGKVSYSLYLWHWLVRVALDHSRVSLPRLPLICTWAALSIALAAASYYFVEVPARRWLDARHEVRNIRLMSVAGGVLATILILFGATQPLARKSIDSLGSVAVAPPNVPAQPFEPLLTNGQEPRILVLGDSVGTDLALGLKQLADVHSMSVMDLAVAGCPLILEPSRAIDYLGRWANDGAVCSQVIERFDEAATSFQPNIVLLAFGRFEDPDRELPSGEVASPCNPNYDRWRFETWSTLIAHLQSVDVGIATITTAYGRPFGYDPADDDQTDCLNTQTTLAASSTGIRLVDLGKWTCPSRECRSEIDGVPLRHDGVHFGEQTSPIAAAWILDQVLEGWRINGDGASPTSQSAAP